MLRVTLSTDGDSRAESSTPASDREAIAESVRDWLLNRAPAREIRAPRPRPGEEHLRAASSNC